jgi:hypothetical protein
MFPARRRKLRPGRSRSRRHVDTLSKLCLKSRNFCILRGFTHQMNTEEHDDLWHLLGRAKQPTVSPFFARNVVREVRALRQERPGFLGWLMAHWKAPVLATCAVALIAGAAVYNQRSEVPEDGQLMAMAQRVYASPDYQVIGNLDELLDNEQNSVWLSADVY